MQKKITFFVILFALLLSFVSWDYLHKSGKQHRYNPEVKALSVDNGVKSKVPARHENSPKTDVVPIPSGIIPGLDNYMDYVTNGNSLNQLIVSGDTVIAAVTYCDSADAGDPNNGSTLRMRYNYSFNRGSTWEQTLGIDMSNDQKSRYPDMYLFTISGFRTVNASGRYFTSPPSSTTRKPGTSHDLLLGIANPTVTLLDGAGSGDMFSTVRPDGKFGMVFQDTDTLLYVTFDPDNHTFSFPRTQLFLPTWDPGTNSYVVSYDIGSAANSNHMTVAYCYINEPLNTGGDPYRSVRVQSSTDNGMTWSTPVKYGFPGGAPIIGGDSTETYWHEDVAYKPGTTDPYIVYSTAMRGSTLGSYRRGAKICIQSPVLNSGDPVVIADWHNIPFLADSALFENNLFDIQVNAECLSHPSVGFSTDGSTIWVTYSVIQKDTCSGYALIFNYFDVYVSKSTDGGMTWTTPQNISNTQNEDEMYPVVAKTGNSNDYPFLAYQWSLIPGCQGFTDFQTITISHQVLKSIEIGIEPLSNNIPSGFKLAQNYPNPFNPSTNIKFDVASRENIRLSVYDLLGRLVRVIVNQEMLPGSYQVKFDGSNLSSGVFFYKLEAANYSEVRKMVLVK